MFKIIALFMIKLFISLYFKTKIPQCRNISKIQKEEKLVLLAHKYMTAHFPGLVLLAHKYMTAHFPGLVLQAHKYMTAHFPGLVLLAHKYMTAHFPGLVQSFQ